MSLLQLYHLTTNIHQKNIFHRIMNESDYAKIYFAGYNSIDNEELFGIVDILGTFNYKKNKRENYKIKIHKNNHLTCSCPDFIFNSNKKNTLCKHICFLICKILKHYDIEFFNTKVLSTPIIEKLINKISNNNIFNDLNYTRKTDKITLDFYKHFTKDIDDCCPICFDDMDKKELACPCCHNMFHQECMEIWLEAQLVCSMCRSNLWKYYPSVKNGEVISLDNTI